MYPTIGLLLLILIGGFAQAATTFDLSADFSFQNTPGRVWQYGSATNSLDPAEFRVDEHADATAPLDSGIRASVADLAQVGIPMLHTTARGSRVWDPTTAGPCGPARLRWVPAIADSTVWFVRGAGGGHLRNNSAI